MLCAHGVTSQEGAGLGVCSGSGVEIAHSRSLLSRLCPEICAVPFRAGPGAHVLLLLSSRSNSRRCHNLTNDDIREAFASNMGFCFLLFVDGQGSIIYLYAERQSMNTRKGTSLCTQSWTEGFSRKWCLAWNSEGVVTSYRQGHGRKGAPKPHQDISAILFIWSFTWCGRLNKGPPKHMHVPIPRTCG